MIYLLYVLVFVLAVLLATGADEPPKPKDEEPSGLPLWHQS